MKEITKGTITEFSFDKGQYGYLQKNEPLKFTNIGESKSYIQTKSLYLAHDITLSFYNSSDETWVTKTFGPSSENDYLIEIEVGGYVLVKGENDYISSGTNDYIRIIPPSDDDKQANIKLEGSIMSLMGEYTRNIPCNYCFCNLFAASASGNNTFATLDVTGLQLPSHKVMPYCYYNLFKGQTNLVTPIFPEQKVWLKSMCVGYLQGTGVTNYEIEFTANDLGQLQYFSADCENLSSAKITAHGATTRQEFAYMFRNCNSLTEVTLDCEDFAGQDVCKNMFEGVTTTGILWVRPELVDNPVINAAIPATWTILPIGAEPPQRQNEIWYTTTDGNIVEISRWYEGEPPISNIYADGKGVLTFGYNLEDITELFDYSQTLATCILPNGVTIIGDYAFDSCENLVELNIPSSVTTIGEYALEYTAITSITIPNSVTTIGQGAFDNTPLTSITIPAGVISIGDGAFNGIYLQRANFINNSDLDEEENEYWGAIIYDELTDDGLYIRNNKVIECTKTSATITIPAGVTGIDDNVFSNYANLTSISIPNSVTDIGISAFNGCTGLTSIVLPNNLTDVKNNLLYGCTALTTVTIPNSVTSIGSYVFDGANNITDIHYNGTKENFEDKCNYMYFTLPAQCVLHFTDGDYTVQQMFEYIDLGLTSGTKWCTKNFDADTDIKRGAFVAFGEDEKNKQNYNWETYKWCDGTDHTLTKYNFNSTYGTVDNKYTLDNEDDIVYTTSNGKLCIPTKSQFNELSNECTFKWGRRNGEYGLTVTGPNGKNLFFAASGYKNGTTVTGASSYGYYITNTLAETDPTKIYSTDFNSSSTKITLNKLNRNSGRTIRPVKV